MVNDPLMEEKVSTETPEDVAVLYNWANLQGAQYRDFSASRREYRAQMHRRAAEQRRKETAERSAQMQADAALREAAEREEAQRISTERAAAEQAEELNRARVEQTRAAAAAARAAQMDQPTSRQYPVAPAAAVPPPFAPQVTAAMPSAPRTIAPMDVKENFAAMGEAIRLPSYATIPSFSPRETTAYPLPTFNREPVAPVAPKAEPVQSFASPSGQAPSYRPQPGTQSNYTRQTTQNIPSAQNVSAAPVASQPAHTAPSEVIPPPPAAVSADSASYHFALFFSGPVNYHTRRLEK